jgi:probable O-glycosylation ligase (exosortase A-associated)
VPLRELALIGIVAVICATAILRPKYGIFGYLWYGLMRPDVLAWIEDDRNIYGFLILLATAIGSLTQLHNLSALFRSTWSRLVIFLQIPIALSVIFAYRLELAWPRYSFFIKMILGLLLVPLLIRTVQDLKVLTLLVAGSLGFIGLKYGVFGVVHGGVELASGYGPVLADNNFVALALAMACPICWFARGLTDSKWIKLMLLAMAGGCIPGVIMTNSRGGALSLGVGMLLIFLRSRNKLVPVLLIAVCLAGSVYLVQEMFVSRMSTLQDYEDEASAASRLWHLKAALRMSLDYPIFGVGFGGINYAVLSTRYDSMVDGAHVAHNSYAQMLVDSGPIAFLLYVSALFGSILFLGRSAKSLKTTHPELEPLPRALQSGLIVFAFGSTFYSCQRIDLPYLLILMAGVWQELERGLPAVAAAVSPVNPVDSAASAAAPDLSPVAGPVPPPQPAYRASFRALKSAKG